jgi:two-component system, chemotaxis family, sensor kinase CheA
MPSQRGQGGQGTVAQSSMGAMSGAMGDRGGARKESRTVFESRRPSSMRMSIVRQYIVVTAVGSRKLGLVVDALIEEQDVVIKALGASLKNVRGFAGATELADQRLALVLDTPALIEEMHDGAERGRGASEQRGSHG